MLTKMKTDVATASNSIAGYLWALSAIVCWGIMFPVGDLLMKQGTMDAASVGLMRYVCATPLLLAVGLLAKGKAMFPQRGLDWLWLSLLGLIGSAAMALLLFVAQRTVEPVNASLLEAYVPMQVILIGWLGGKRTSWRQLASVAVGFGGSLLVLRAVDGSGIKLAAIGLGDLLVFLSGLCWAVYTALGRGISNRLGGIVFTTWTVFFGAVWLAFWMLANGGSLLLPSSALEWKCILFLAVFPTGIAFLGWNQAHKSVSLAHLSFMEYFPPLVAALADIAFFNGRVTAWQWAGMAIVIAAAYANVKGKIENQ